VNQHFAPLTHHTTTGGGGGHLLQHLIDAIVRGFGWHIGTDAARMVPDWLVILIVVGVIAFAIAAFVKRRRGNQ
jgi:hypothetical protein